jgi:hypothetical protein
LVAELVPGFSVGAVFGFFQVGGEGYVDLVLEGGGWDYVPGVGFDYVGGYEVYLAGGVGEFVVGYVALVGASAFVFGALDLDAEEAAVMFDGEVVAGHVSPGLGDAESVLGGAGHEAQFGPLAPELGVLDVDTFVGHVLPGNGFRKGQRRRTGVSAPHWVPMKNAALVGPRYLSYSSMNALYHMAMGKHAIFGNLYLYCLLGLAGNRVVFAY